MGIIRITMFKIPRENIPKLLENYRVLAKSATKDNKPYILSLQAGPAKEDARSQGFTLVAKSEFKDLTDMKYYDEECEAHKELKVHAKGYGVEGIMTVYYEAEVNA
ncbi:hypothetical protein BGZ60DRAFT_386383 [Tricladium varicosporioides]|nr:hypothetical protein BGZ60DRAFT_386383 [Hymenoscyphus varicosporioides]